MRERALAANSRHGIAEAEARGGFKAGGGIRSHAGAPFILAPKTLAAPTLSQIFQVCAAKARRARELSSGLALAGPLALPCFSWTTLGVQPAPFSCALSHSRPLPLLLPATSRRTTTARQRDRHCGASARARAYSQWPSGLLPTRPASERVGGEAQYRQVRPSAVDVVVEHVQLLAQFFKRIEARSIDAEGRRSLVQGALDGGEVPAQRRLRHQLAAPLTHLPSTQVPEHKQRDRYMS